MSLERHGKYRKRKTYSEQSQTRKRTAQFYEDNSDTIWSYFVPNTKNPCSCGSNCYHCEYDGNRVIGVCNACGADIYEVKEEYTDEYLSKGVWKEINKAI